MKWLKRLVQMARKGILTLAGIASGGSVNVPPENPPGSVTPPPPPVSTQTVNMQFVTSPQALFAPTLTRELIASQNVVLATAVVSSQTIFQPGASIVSGLQNTSLPLVTSNSFVLSPSTSMLGAFQETFSGANGLNWDAARWTNKRTTTGAIGDIQGGTGRLTTGTLTNYTGASGYQTVNSYSNFELSGDLIIPNADVCYPMIGFRSGTSWAPTHASAQDSYWLEIKRNELGTYLYKRVGDSPQLLTSNPNFSYATGDSIHFRINCNGTTLRTRMWKNAETEPSTWDITFTDTSFTAGKIYLAVNGGPDAVADEVRFDNINIVGSAVAQPPPVVPPPATTSLVRIGATWTGVRPAASMNSVVSVHDTQAQHIIGFGAENGIELNPSLGVYNWNAFEPAFNEMMATSPTKPIIIFCRAPGWMKATGVTQDDAPVLPAHFQNYATLCAAVAARYTQVKYFSVWNEMKGFYNNTLNRWDYEGYTAMYNAIWTKVKAVRPDAKIGGPYVILQSGSTGTSWSHGPTTGLLAFPGGSMDLRQVDVMTYFRDNALGFDFLSCDGGIENQFGAQFGADPHQQLEKLWGWWRWVRANIHPTCELINFETYVNQTSVAPYSYTQAQREDLFIELCQKTLANVPNPNVTYLTWFHPLFWPQVVNKQSDFVWANTESTFRAKVATLHGTTPPPPTGGTTWQVPAQGSLQAVADLAVAGDTIYVTGTVQASGTILRIINRDNGNNPISVIGNPGNILRGGTGGSGIEGYGSNRGWLFQNLNIEISGGNNLAPQPDGQPYNGHNYYGECFYFAGERTTYGGDGLGCTNIRIIGCTGRPIAGTGSVQRHGAAVWGAGTVEIGNCDFSDCGYNDNGFSGGAASGISVGRSIASNSPTLSNGARVWIHGNKIRNVKGPGTSSDDRNGIIMDIYHGWTSGPNAFWSNREHGAVIIEANDIANCEGRGIQLLCAGTDDSPVYVRNNLVRAPIATNLGPSAPDTGIGGYGVGLCSNIHVDTNDVTVSSGHKAYYFISFNGGNGSGVTGSGNIGTPVVFDGSPGNSPPAGF